MEWKNKNFFKKKKAILFIGFGQDYKKWEGLIVALIVKETCLIRIDLCVQYIYIYIHESYWVVLILNLKIFYEKKN